jgi:non-homologous end joining protein Ku
MRMAENARGVVIAAIRHMARGLWTGALSFGLVNIPVEVHTAVRETRPHFRLLHAKDRSPINYERVCQKDGDAVAWDDLVKGYEYEKGRFVVLTKADFTAARSRRPGASTSSTSSRRRPSTIASSTSRIT